MYSELPSFVTEPTQVAYCYEGRHRRGSIAIKNNGSVLVITPTNYISSYDDQIDDNSGFELWAFIDEMLEEEMFEIRQEAVNRLFDIYCDLYQFLPVFQEYPFRTE